MSVPTTAMSIVALRSAGSRRAARATAPSPGAGTRSPAAGRVAAATAVTTAAATASPAKGSARETASLSRPDRGGPTRWATPPTATVLPTAERGASGPESRVTPAVQIAAKPTPNRSRPARNGPNPAAVACTAADTAISAPAASETRSAPQRSAASPAGTAAASVASVAIESSAPVAAGESPKSRPSAGSSGTSMDWPSSAQNTSAQMARTETGRRRDMRKSSTVGGNPASPTTLPNESHESR